MKIVGHYNNKEIEAGFLIVKTYQKLYLDYVTRYNLTRDWYAIPRIDKNPEQNPIQYRGLDRDALSEFEDSDILAEIRLAELNTADKCFDGLIVQYTDAQEAYNYLDDKQNYEIIWTRIAGCTHMPQPDFLSIGFEPTYFVGDHFAAQCDCMLFPRWHGTDDEGILFMNYFHKLNEYGLFNSPQEAREFLDYYLSFDWTETGDYGIAEVLIRK